MEKITSYDEAITASSKLGAQGLVPTVWIPKSGFEYALLNTDGSVSFTRDGFGLGVGPDPIIDPTWQRFALPKTLAKEKTLDFKLVNRWNPYQIQTLNFTDTKGVSEIGEAGIKEFLDANAPESSVYPGNPETVFWAGLIVNNELVAVGALSKWESGKFVISSIATKITERNKGYGQIITEGIIALANQRGIGMVRLAVNAKNEVAMRVYEKIGFESMGSFNTFERN